MLFYANKFCGNRPFVKSRRTENRYHNVTQKKVAKVWKVTQWNQKNITGLFKKWLNIMKMKSNTVKSKKYYRTLQKMAKHNEDETEETVRSIVPI